MKDVPSPVTRNSNQNLKPPRPSNKGFLKNRNEMTTILISLLIFIVSILQMWSFKIRGITFPRFPTLRLLQVLLVFNQIFFIKLCNGFFIDPYLEDIYTVRDFQPRKITFLQLLDPIESRLARSQPIISLQEPAASNVVEVRVKPPAGFLENQGSHPIDDPEDMLLGDTMTVVRTVSSVSEKITKLKKPFLSADIGDKKKVKEKSETKDRRTSLPAVKKDFVIKRNKLVNKPVVVMKELPKPTKEALLVSNEKNITHEGTVVSIEKKKVGKNKQGANVYRIKKKRKVDKKGEKIRPNFDPRKNRETTTSTTTTRVPEPETKAAFMPTPVPFHNLDIVEEDTTSDTILDTFEILPTAMPLNSNNNENMLSDLHFETLEIDEEESAHPPAIEIFKNSNVTFENIEFLPTSQPLISSENLGVFQPTSTAETKSDINNLQPKNFKIFKEMYEDEKASSHQPAFEIFKNSNEKFENIEILPTSLPLVSSENFNVFQPSSEDKKSNILQPRNFEIFKEMYETEKEIKSDLQKVENLVKSEGDNEEEGGAADYKSRSLRIFPNNRRRQKKKPPLKLIPVPPPTKIAISLPKTPYRRLPKPQSTLVVKPIRPRVPSKVRLYYNKKKRKVNPPLPPPPPPPSVSSNNKQEETKQQKLSKLKGYEHTLAAFESNKDRPFKGNPEFTYKPLEITTAPLPEVTPSLTPFRESQEEVIIPRFPVQPSYESNFNSDFGLKLTTPKNIKPKNIKFSTVSPLLLKVNPIGVINDDDKWHPVSRLSTTTSKPLILEGSAKTLGDFVAKTKSTDDSVAKLLVKDPYDTQKISTFTDRIDHVISKPYEPTNNQGSYPSSFKPEPIYKINYQPNYQPKFLEELPKYDPTFQSPIEKPQQEYKEEEFKPIFRVEPYVKSFEPYVQPTNKPTYQTPEPWSEPVPRYEPSYQDTDPTYQFKNVQPKIDTGYYYPSETKYEAKFEPIYRHDFDHHRGGEADPLRSSKKLPLPVIKSHDFPEVVEHISSYSGRSRSLEISDDLVDFGAATGGNGAFGWYSDHPVNEGLFSKK